MAVSGSSVGLSIIDVATAAKKKALVIVESELDAYAVDYFAGDMVAVVAVGSNTKNPDNYTNHIAKAAYALLICHDNDNAGQIMLKKWKQMYPHARAYPTPIGKDIGEAIIQGFDIRSWLLKELH